MFQRLLVSVAFVIGGIITLAVLWALRALGHMESGMSAGPIAGSPIVDALIPWFAVSYFVVSAVGILISKKRSAVRFTAVLAHSMLLITFCLLCLEASNGDIAGLFLTIVKLLIPTVIFFSPWLAIWYWILLIRSDQ